jgi:segregation and condensation protein A
LSFSLAELLGAVDRVIRIARKPNIHEVIPRALDVDGAIGVVRAILAMRANAQWSDVVPKEAEPWQVLSVLLALLELAKLGELRLDQPRAFAPVAISRDTTSEAA